MENNTKITNEQINSMLDDFKGNTGKEKIDANEFINKHLNEDQANALNKAMNNPELINSILSSPQAKKFLEKLAKKDWFMDLSNLNMDNIGSILNSLSDEDMESIKGMASTFFGSGEESSEPKQNTNQSTNQANSNQSESSSDFDFNLDFESIAKITSIMSKLSNKKKDPRSDLLMALRPLLSQSRQEKVDQATKIIQLLEILPLLKEMN